MRTFNYEEVQRNAEEMTDEISDLKKKLNSTKRQLAEVQKEKEKIVESKKAKVQEKGVDKGLFERTRDELRATVKEVSKERLAKQDAEANLKKFEKKTNREIESLKSQLDAEQEKQSKKIEKLTKSVIQKELEMSHMVENQKRAKEKEKDKRIKETEARKERLKEMNTGEQGIEDLKRTIETLMADLGRKDLVIAEQEDSLEQLEKDKEEARNRVHTLEEELEELNEESEKLRIRVADLEDDVEAKDEKIADLSSRANGGEEELETLNEKIFTLEANLEKTKEELVKATMVAKDAIMLESKVEVLEESVIKFEKVTEVMKIEIQGKEVNLQALTKEVEELKNDVESFEETLQDTQTRYKNTASKLHILETEIDEARMSKENAEAQYEQGRAELQLAQARMTDYNKFKDKAKTFDRLKDEVVTLRDMKNRFDLFKKSAADVIKLKTEMTQLENTHSELEKEMKNAHNKSDEDEQRIHDLENELQIKDRMIDTAVEKTMLKVQAAREEQDRGEKLLGKLQKEMAYFVSEAYYAEIMIVEKDQKLISFEEKMAEITAANTNLQGYIEKGKTLEMANKRLQKENTELADRAREAIRMELDLKDDKRKLNEQLEIFAEKVAIFEEPENKASVLKDKISDQYEQIMNMVLDINKRKNEHEILLDLSENRRKKIAEDTEIIEVIKLKLINVEQALEEKNRQGVEFIRREKEKMSLEFENRGLSTQLNKVDSLSKDLNRKDLEIKDLNNIITGLNQGNVEFVTLVEHKRVTVDLEQTRSTLVKKSEIVNKLEEEKLELEDKLKRAEKRRREFEMKCEERREEVNRLIIRTNELAVKMNQGLIREQTSAGDVRELKEIIDYKNRLNKLETEKIMDLRTRVVELENENKFADERTRLAEREARRVQETVSGLERAKEDLQENQIYHTTNFIDKMKSKDQDLFRKIADLNYKDGLVKRLEEKRAELEERVKNLEKELRDRSKNETIIVSGRGIDSTSMRSIRSKSRRANPIDIIREIEEKAKLNTEMNKLKEDNAELDRRLREMQKENEGKVHMFVDDKVGLETKMNDLIAENEKLKEISKKSKHKDVFIDTLKAKLKDHVIRLQALERTVVKKEEFYKAEILKLSSVVDEMNKAIVEKITKSVVERERKELLRKRLMNTEKEVTKLKMEKNALTVEKELLLEQLAGLEGDKEYLGREFEMKKNLVIELKNKELEIQNMIKRREGIETLLSDQKRLTEQRNNDLKVKDEHLSKLRDDLALEKKDLTQMRKDRDELHKEIQNAIREKDDSMGEQIKMKSEISTLKNLAIQAEGEQKKYIASLQSKNEKLMANNSRKKKEINSLSGKLEKTGESPLRKQHIENTDLRNKLERVDILLGKMSEKVLGLKEENEHLREIIQKMNNDPKLGHPAILELNEEVRNIRFKLDAITRKYEREKDLLKRQKDSSDSETARVKIMHEELQKNFDIMAGTRGKH